MNPDTWTVLSSFNHTLEPARGEHGIINGTPTPGKLEEEPGQISAEWTGVGVPFIIPCSPRARQWSEETLTEHDRWTLTKIVSGFIF
jgi:hypothetical protein